MKVYQFLILFIGLLFVGPDIQAQSISDDFALDDTTEFTECFLATGEDGKVFEITINFSSIEVHREMIPHHRIETETDTPYHSVEVLNTDHYNLYKVPLYNPKEVEFNQLE